MSLTPELRNRICGLCRNKRQRRAQFSAERPVVWQPTSIVDPKFGLPFTGVGAWQFIADLIESGHPFREIELRKPRGAIGYEAKKELADGKVIYMKIELCGSVIFGRSFHYDQPPDERDWN